MEIFKEFAKLLNELKKFVEKGKKVLLRCNKKIVGLLLKHLKNVKMNAYLNRSKVNYTIKKMEETIIITGKEAKGMSSLAIQILQFDEVL